MLVLTSPPQEDTMSTNQTPVAATTIATTVPYGRDGNNRHTGMRTGTITEVLAYGTGEDDGLVTVRVNFEYNDSRVVTALAEDIRLGASPLGALGASAQWAHWKAATR
jgi:hypothetical protein